LKLKLSEITKDNDIYPRLQISQKLIEGYVEAVKAGAQFPPITVQRVNVDGTEEIICLDGWHRIETYKLYNKSDGASPIDEVEVDEWKPQILDKQAHLVDMLVAAYELNAKQGIHPSPADAKSQLEKIAQTENALSLPWKDIANSFQVTPQWVSECVSPFLAEKRMSRDGLIYKLILLGYTYKEVASMAETSEPTIAETLKKLNQLKNLSKVDFYEKKKKAEDIAAYYHIDLALLWAVLLEDKDDVDRFKLFGDTKYGNDQPKLTDYWKFSEREPDLGSSTYPGNLYGQEAMNIIYRYSRQGHLVVDPMAGGGITPDACLLMNRKCRAYDKKPSKPEIQENDILNGYPDRAKNCQLVIFDPPYYKKKEGDYGVAFSADRPTFLANIERVSKSSREILVDGGYIALLYGQYIDYENELTSTMGEDLCRLFNGFRLVMKIQSPLTFDQQYSGYDVERAKQSSPWQILPVSKDWYIFKKVKANR